MSQGRALLPDWGGQLGPQAHPEATAAPGLACSCAPACGPQQRPAFVSTARGELRCFTELLLPTTAHSGKASFKDRTLPTYIRDGWDNHRGETLGDLFAHTQRPGCTRLPSKIHRLPAKSLSFLLEKLKFILGCPVTASSFSLQVSFPTIRKNSGLEESQSAAWPVVAKLLIFTWEASEDAHCQTLRLGALT